MHLTLAWGNTLSPSTERLSSSGTSLTAMVGVYATLCVRPHLANIAYWFYSGNRHVAMVLVDWISVDACPGPSEDSSAEAEASDARLFLSRSFISKVQASASPTF